MPRLYGNEAHKLTTAIKNLAGTWNSDLDVEVFAGAGTESGRAEARLFFS